MRSKAHVVESGEVSPPRGGFVHDGSWNEDMPRHPKGATHRLVDELVRSRRAGTLRLEMAANAIEAANARHAFPNVDQWRTAQGWVWARCSTSAERAVVSEGRGAGGHWCGERYAAGAERDCADQRHRSLPRPEEVRALLSAVVASLPSVPRETVGPAYGQSGVRADEAYFARWHRAQRPGQ